MQPVSSAFLTEIQRDHQLYTYADVFTPTGQKYRLNVVDGSVKVDRTAAVRRSGSFTLVDPTGSLTPLDSTSPLAPFGSIIKPYRGVKYTTGALAGSTEVVPLGIMRISQSHVTDTGDGLQGISVDCYDLSRTMSRDKFTVPYGVDQGTNIIAAIIALIKRSFPDAQFDAISSSITTAAPLSFNTGDDPWQDMTDNLAVAAGVEVYQNVDGTWKVAPPSDVNSLPAPVWQFVEGPGCQLIEADLMLTDDPGYNGVILTTDSTGDATAPIRSEVWDNDPASPTYYLGPYDDVPYFVNNSTVTTQADADAAALAQLNLILGVQSQLSITAMVNPALDAGDTVLVQRARDGINAKYAVDGLTIPMSASGTMAVTVRQKRSR